MAEMITLEHCKRAISDAAHFGDNDVVPFDIDTKFISDKPEQFAIQLRHIAQHLEKKSLKDCRSTLNSVQITSERLLAPVGQSGFRITTKIHPMWNLYLNAIAIALAEVHEANRAEEACSYRFAPTGPSIFNKDASWRTFREASLTELDNENGHQVVIQTDISSFYEHVYHHRLQNFIDDLTEADSNISTQIDIIIKKLAHGRSFGLPVGGQASRVFSEVLLGSIDRTLKTEKIPFRRYVDDFVLFADSHEKGYEALGILAHALADLGLSINRTKTSILSANNYKDYVEAQLAGGEGGTQRIKQMDLHFDPYSDTATDDYESLKNTVAQIDLAHLVKVELSKGQPDRFVVTQIGRSLAYLDPDDALTISMALLDSRNIHAFRASWSTIMRGIAHLRLSEEHSGIHGELDSLLDRLPSQVPHLVRIDTNLLHFLRTLRFRHTQQRSVFVLDTYKNTSSATIRRACIDCWRHWKDRDRFLALRNNWTSLSPGEQRMLWLAAPSFGDDGTNFKKQVRKSVHAQWGLGLQLSNDPFVDLFLAWSDDAN